MTVRDSRRRLRLAGPLLVVMLAASAGATSVALAARLCLDLTTDDGIFVLQGLQRRIPKRRAGALTGHLVTASGTTVRPVSGSYVANAAGTSVGIALVEFQVAVTAIGGGTGQITRFVQLLASPADGKLDVDDTLPAVCSWTRHSDGTTSGDCSGDVVVRDCKQVPPIP